MRMSFPAAEGLTSPEIEIAEGGTMLDSKGKFNDLKSMLDSNRENVKMDAMKRIINMVARGKDVSELFPAVVKNVACKNLELKKLVYVYLVRYAEEQQDLALLSISTFQRALKDPNQLIRAGALRVLSSIRVQMIAPVVMLAIKDSVRDMSPYVRKVAAHAIPKLFALEPELQSQLIDCIDFLLGDKRTLVLGSAVYAFEETCPDRLDLLHRHFRLLCRALADVDEWGQVVMIGLLTRYARTQFTSPFLKSKKAPNGTGEEQELREIDACDSSSCILDPDHNLLIVSVRPLLQSRNPAVVMAVAQLLFHIAPPSQLAIVPKSLVRLLRGPNEVQYVVLVNIATICAARHSEDVFAISKNLFEPFLKSFFVRNSDTLYVKQLKLQVLTSLVSEANVQLVIRELQAYLQMSDVADAAIDSIGRCALQVPNSAETCLSSLIRIISTSSQEQLICASVVVLKRLLHADAPLDLLKRVFRLINTVKAPMARSCILWLVGTHIGKVPGLAPDLLRIVVKTFCEEADCVKLQALNLAIRIWVTNPQNREGKCALLVKYLFQLARYDRSYDIRDRCRFLRNFLFNDGRKEGKISFPMETFLSERPSPSVQNAFADRAEHFQLGTLSHLLNQKCVGYTELPDFPQDQPDPAIRRAAYPLPSDAVSTGGGGRSTDLAKVMEEDASSEEEDTEDEDELEDEEDVDEEEEDEEDDEEEEESGSDGRNEATTTVRSDSKRSDAASTKPSQPEEAVVAKKLNEEGKKSANDDFLLLDLDFGPGQTCAGILSKWSRAPTQYVTDEFSIHLVDPPSAGGIALDGRFCRSPCLHSTSMVCVELQISFRSGQLRTSDFHISPSENSLPPTSGQILLTALNESEPRRVTLGIDFGDSAQTSTWVIKWVDAERTAKFEIQAPFGEQVECIEMEQQQFLENRRKLSGMNQMRFGLYNVQVGPFIAREIYRVCNCKQLLGLKFCFAAQTISRKELVLLSLVEREEGTNEWDLQLNCENMAFAALLGRELAQKLSK